MIADFGKAPNFHRYLEVLGDISVRPPAFCTTFHTSTFQRFKAQSFLFSGSVCFIVLTYLLE